MTTAAPARRTFKARVARVKWATGDYGPYTGITIDVLPGAGAGVPERGWFRKPSRADLKEGDVISLTATLDGQSADGKLGFYKRPVVVIEGFVCPHTTLERASPGIGFTYTCATCGGTALVDEFLTAEES